MPFPRLRKVKAHEQVAEAIRDRILAGDVQPGDRLPAERDLAVQFGVGRPTVREALKALEQQHLVEVRHGGGVNVLDYSQAGLGVLPYLLWRGGRLDGALLRDLLEVRQVFGVALVRLAAARATAGDIDGLRALVAAEAAAGELLPEELGDLDFDFFSALAAVARNRVFRFVLNALKYAYRMRRSLFASLFPDATDLIDTHRGVVDALAERDVEAAALAIERHLSRPLGNVPPG